MLGYSLLKYYKASDNIKLSSEFNFNKELNQIKELYNNVDVNINNWLNSKEILEAFIIGYYYFKMLNNKGNLKPEDKNITKKIFKYYWLIILRLENKANKKQLQVLNYCFKYDVKKWIIKQNMFYD